MVQVKPPPPPPADMPPLPAELKNNPKVGRMSTPPAAVLLVS